MLCVLRIMTKSRFSSQGLNLYRHEYTCPLKYLCTGKAGILYRRLRRILLSQYCTGVQRKTIATLVA
jgi:hypothetical protein